MVRNFIYRNIAFKKYEQSEYLVMRGEITNKTGKDYNSVVFRIILFIKNRPHGYGIATINGFNSGQTRSFETLISELNYAEVIKDITGFEIFPESAY